MTKISMETVTCPKCGKEGSYKLYDSINVGVNPELKGMLYTDESPLIFTCPHCGEKFAVRYDFLYHDMDKKYMIWCVPSGRVPKSPAEELKDGLDKGLAQDILQFHEGYRYRYVRDSDELLEKIMELDSAYPDYAWEILKVLSRMQIDEQLTDKGLQVEGFRFRDMNDEKIVCTFLLDHSAASVDIAMDTLKSIAKGFQFNEGDGFVRVNDEWAAKFLQACNAAENSSN